MDRGGGVRSEAVESGEGGNEEKEVHGVDW